MPWFSILYVGFSVGALVGRFSLVSACCAIMSFRGSDCRAIMSIMSVGGLRVYAFLKRRPNCTVIINGLFAPRPISPVFGSGAFSLFKFTRIFNFLNFTRLRGGPYYVITVA